ncbi:MAG: TolC family protein, partial [Pseudomonadota bacterium]
RLRGAVALGAVREADAALADLAYEEAQALALERRLRARNAERRLATLTNRAAGTLRLEDAATGYPARLPVLDPVAALRSRPDVGAAEARVRAAFARSGVAEAALYPQISLVATAGLSAPRASLDEPGARRFAGGDLLTWSLFDRPGVRAPAQAADAEADAELAGFHATALAALEEADAAIDGWQTALGSADRIDAARAAASRAATLVEARRAAGLASALDVARSRADAMEWELAAVDARGQARHAWAAALLALGAGWRDGDVRP